MKIRIKFKKQGVMRFIGHLDMMRYFQKAMRRADIDIAYSEGYSPHQIMSFAAPLGVGITSDGEYLDIEVQSSKSSVEALKALNEAMAEGVQVTEYKQLPAGAKNAMSSVAAADYTVTFKEKEKNPFTLFALSQNLLDFYLNQPEIIITKQTKKSEKIMNLKPLIYDLKAIEEENPGFYMRVSTGSADNIKPELVLNAFFEYCNRKKQMNLQIELMDLQIHRMEVFYAGQDGTFLPLGALGQDIE